MSQQPQESQQGAGSQAEELQKRELSAEEVLTRPAEEFVNDEQVEMAWLSAAVRHMETYYKLITSVSPLTNFKLTSNDDLVYEAFKTQFPELNVEVLTEEAIKSPEGMCIWLLIGLA